MALWLPLAPHSLWIFFDGKNLEKTKKNKTLDTMARFLVSARVFFHQTSNMAKTSKTKKNKIAHPHCLPILPLAVCNLVFFFGGGFRRFRYFCQKTRDNKANLHTPRGEQWQRVGTCFFCFLGFFPKNIETPTQVNHREEALLGKDFFKELTT